MRRVGRMADAELADRLNESPQVLCIVNTRRHARELYEQLADAEGACHLSTLMCASHRRAQLDAVRQRLKDGKPVRLIATSLVEAGVDVDFPIVWRAEAGLESIIQAAGRCNREGRAPQGDVFVFEPAPGEGRKPPPDIAQFADAARSVMRRYPDDSMSLDAIRAYFRELYWSKGDAALDAKQILRQCAERRRSLDFPFETIAREFRLIEDAQLPVVVSWRGKDGNDDTAARLLRDLEHAPRPGLIARRLQPYLVQIPPPGGRACSRSVPPVRCGRRTSGGNSSCWRISICTTSMSASSSTIRHLARLKDSCAETPTAVGPMATHAYHVHDTGSCATLISDVGEADAAWIETCTWCPY